ncbi:hypothetical protein [Nostocoides sp. HKS02]|uniref:hypothetical protein n=1 Tax=Nostocoides sp. HKS02 TaxID=1813880 RepID=UPI0012B444AC|nr:hypothetical protein [Tetrasphaera sp. HKS02]QGN58974.1 hypothetical protein GKE56_14955 [Tetrasphaera sp. HKS02]
MLESLPVAFHDLSVALHLKSESDVAAPLTFFRLVELADAEVDGDEVELGEDDELLEGEDVVLGAGAPPPPEHAPSARDAATRAHPIMEVPERNE